MTENGSIEGGAGLKDLSGGSSPCVTPSDLDSQLSSDEMFDICFGLALVAKHHEDQINDWRIRPEGDRRNEHVREWEDNQARIVAHHEQRIRELSALVGRLGGRDWIAAKGAR